jgi:hypothetical protein
MTKASQFTETASASLGFFRVSAPRFRRAEYVRVIPIVITPFEFRNVQRQVLAADFVEAAHNAAFQERPETINRLSMDCAVNILASAVPDNAMPFQLAIAGVIVSRNQANFFQMGKHPIVGLSLSGGALLRLHEDPRVPMRAGCDP